MAFIPVPNAVKVVITFSLAGQLVNLTLGLEKASAVSVSDLETAATGTQDWAVNELLPWLSSQLTLTGMEAYDLSSASAPVVAYSLATPHAGSAASPSLPNNAAAVISFRTDQRGRSARGRMYVPGIPQNVQASATTLGTAFVAALTQAGADINSYLTSVPFTHVVISRYTNNAPRAVGTTEAVTSVVMDNKIDSQRRRLSGRGI